MNNYKFNLSGMGDSTLEDNVRKSVENASYSDQELSDLREPLQYNLFDPLYNQDILKQSLAHLQRATLLQPDIVILKGNNNLKSFFKLLSSKFFKWYIDPVAEYQSRFNYETSSIVSQLAYSLKIQEDLIKRLQDKINELKNNV